MKPLPPPARIFIGFLCAALATTVGMLLPLIVHGVRNLPWEVVFGFAYYFTGFFRSSQLGYRLDGLIGGILWPLVVIAFVWFAASRICAAGAFVRVASLALFILSLAACVPAETFSALGCAYRYSSMSLSCATKRSNQSLQPTALSRCASMSILISFFQL